MKIKAICRRCGRELMTEQVVASGGSCPWDGEPFQPDYALQLVEALQEAEDAGSRLERALAAIADVSPNFTIVAGSVIGGTKSQIARLERVPVAGR